MVDFMKYIQQTPSENKKLTRGYSVDESTLSIGFDSEPTKYDFGLSPKDSIEFSVFSSEGIRLAWKVVDDEPNFEVLNLDYTNLDGDRISGQARLFTSNYPSIDGNVVVSPSIDAKSVGIDSGYYYMRYSFLNDIVGSSANKSKLLIKEISNSRTEIKVIPECLKTSLRAEDISLSFDYVNFTTKKLPVSHLYNFTDKLLREDKNLLSQEFDTEMSEIISNYEDSIELTLEMLGTTTRKQVFIEIDSVRKRVFELYKNTLISEYNEVYTRTDFYVQYINCINYEISKQKRLADSGVDPLIIDLYKSVLVTLYDSDYLNRLFVDRFELYFNNYVNFGQGEMFPILGTQLANENIGDEDKHTPLIIKLSEALPANIGVGSRLYISNKLYSDDVVQKVTYFKEIKSSLTKLRGPNRSQIIKNNGTKEYTKDELDTESGIEEIDESTTKISSYFNKNINTGITSFEEFSDFVKFSSAKRQLDLFIQRFSKISKLINVISSYEYSIETLAKKVEDNLLPEKEANSSIAILQKIELKEKLKELDTELLSLSEYERYLLYTDSPRAYPRTENVYVSGITGKNRLANGRYEKYSFFNDKNSFKHWLGDWYLWWDASSFEWVLSVDAYSRKETFFSFKSESYFFETDVKWGDYLGFDGDEFVKISKETLDYGPEKGKLAPEYIPGDISKWSSGSRGYAWYIDMATEAAYYDKSNDDFLGLNIPEFLVRDDQNEDFLKLLSAVGTIFDVIDNYIKNMGNSREIRNNPEKGIPDELVYYFLNSFGINFTGKNARGDVVSKLKIKDKTSTEYKRNQIWRRILNNLPLILKTKGTRESIEALMRCYDIPEQLFVTREYGGASLEDSSSNFSEFSFDTFDYSLSIENEDEYLEVPWNHNDLKPKSIEFKLIINSEAKIKKTSGDDKTTETYAREFQTIISNEKWNFGIMRFSDYDDGWWRFYFSYKQDGASEETYKIIPDLDKKPLDIKHTDGYDILIQVSRTFRELRRKTLSIIIKRHSDNEIVLTESTDIIIDEKMFLNFSEAKDIYIGNYTGSDFKGQFDRLRIYSEEITEDDFEQHIKYGQSYSLRTTGKSIEDTLLLKTNFDQPHDISLETNYKFGYGVIPNSSLKESHPKYIKCYNFKKTQYPFEFVGSYKREFAGLPNFGAQVFNNKKIRKEELSLSANLNPFNRVTNKSLDRVGVDTNKLGVFFGKSVTLNEEIIKFFGKIKLGDYIGNPEDYTKRTYNELKKLRNLFFKHGFGKVDWNNYINNIKGYFDESFFDNIEKLVPARSLLVSGLLVEPLLLERPKVKGTGLDTNLESNVDRFNIIESTEKIKPLKNIRLSAKNTNKNIIEFANTKVYGERKTDENVICLSSDFTYKNINGKTHKTELFENVDYSNLQSVASNFGHVSINGRDYRVEKDEFTLNHHTSFTNGLIDYTIANKVKLTIKITTDNSNHFSSANGEFLSGKNLNGHRLFNNNAETWFIYFEPYINIWVLVNKDPRTSKNTNEIISDGSVKRIYCTTQGTEFPTNFYINSYTDVVRTLSGSFESWDDMFLITGATGKLPLNTNRIYRATSLVSILNDKFINLSGEILGVVDCEINGVFDGKYNEILSNGTLVVHKKGSYIFRGLKQKIKFDGTFSGTLKRGFVGSTETQSDFVIRNGYVNGKRYGGCYFSDKKLYGNINDVIENDLRYTDLDLSIFDSNKINTTSQTFTNIKLVPVPNKIEYNVDESKFGVTKKVNIERNSTNQVYNIGSFRYRKTIGTYSNCFYHRTKDVFIPALFHEFDIKLNTKIKTNQIRNVKIIGYTDLMADIRTQKNISYKRKFKTEVIKNETYTISMCFDFIYKMETNDYKVSPVLYSRGRNLKNNNYYRITFDEYGDTIRVKENFFDDGWDSLDKIYEIEDFRFLLPKEDVISEFENTNSSLFYIEIDDKNSIAFLANHDSEETKSIDFHSLDFVKNSTEKNIKGEIEILNTRDLYNQTGKIYGEQEQGVSYDTIEIKHNRHHLISNNIKVGDTIRLDVYGKNKTKYAIQTNRELTPDEVDDSEAIIYTVDTLDCHITYDINENFLRYTAETLPLKYHSYFTQESPSDYFLIMPKSEYNGFELSGYNGKWKSANGMYKQSFMLNDKYTYTNVNSEWIVFWSKVTPNCEKDEVKGAWVLAKEEEVGFTDKIQSDLETDKIKLWMYGFIRGEFASEIEYTTSPTINVDTFSSDFGGGFEEFLLKQEASVLYTKDLCSDEEYVKNKIKDSNQNVDTSFVIIPNKEAFRFAEKYGKNTLSVKDQILAWSLNIKSVESKLPARGLYDKVKPMKEVDVQVEVEYNQNFDRIVPYVRLIGADVSSTQYRMVEGDYYLTTQEINNYPVYRNSHGFLMKRDRYFDEETGNANYLWVIAQDSQPLTTKIEDLTNKNRLVFISYTGTCASDDFNFRVGYDMNPNVDTTRDRNDMLADAFRDAVLLDDQEVTVNWGYDRNEQACSTCEDIATPDFKITVSPDNLYTSYAGKKKFITIYQGEVDAEVGINELNPNISTKQFSGLYSHIIGSYCDSEICYHQKSGGSVMKKTPAGWIIEPTVVGSGNKFTTYISSNHIDVKSRGTIFQHPKYGMYKSESGELAFIYYEKNEYSDIKICVDSDNENLKSKFSKTTYEHNNRVVYQNENGWLIFYNIEEISDDEYWCMSDTLSDRNVKYKADIRWKNELNFKEGDRHYDEEFGVYYQKTTNIDFNEKNAIVVNMKINLDEENPTNILNLDRFDINTFSYRLTYDSTFRQESTALEILPVLSRVENKYISELPISINYDPETFYLEYPNLIDIHVLSNGSFEYNETGNTNLTFSLNSFGTTKNFDMKVDIENTFGHVKVDSTDTFSVNFKRNTTDQERDDGYIDINKMYEKYYIDEVNYTLEVDVKTRREPIVVEKNIRKINQQSKFEELFLDDSDENEREIKITFNEDLSYKVNKNYALTDITKLKVNNDIVSRNISKDHLSYKRRFKRTTTQNNVSTTISQEGIQDFTSPITRTRRVFPRTEFNSGSFDSFWFIDDTPVVNQIEEQKPVVVRKGVYELPNDVLDKLEFYYSFNDSDVEFVEAFPTPTPSPSKTETPTPTDD